MVSPWSALGPGIAGDGVYALAVGANGNLYVGGDFGYAGTKPANNIAVWDGTAWSTFGSGTNSRVETLAVDAKGDVSVGGYFTIAGGKPAAHFAIWHTEVVAVGASDFQAQAIGEAIVLAWRLSPSAARDLAGVHVERGVAEHGPFIQRIVSSIAPDLSMTFEDEDVEPARTYWYRLILVGQDGARSIVGPVRAKGRPRSALLSVNSLARTAGPIPIRYEIPSDATVVKILIHDVAGRVVRVLEETVRDAGSYDIAWDRLDSSNARVARGLYLVRFSAGHTVITKRVLVLSR